MKLYPAKGKAARLLGVDEAALAKRELDVASTTEKKALQLATFLIQQFGEMASFHE